MSMNGIYIAVTGNIAKVVERPGKITSGTVGLPVEFSFDSQWEGLRKIAVFQAGTNARVVDDPRVGTVVPWEVLTEPGVWLCIGVYGINEDGTVVIPTVWANVGTIAQGVSPDGDPSTDPTLPIWQEMMNRINNQPTGGTTDTAPVVCTATPATLASVIARAKPNTTIQLTAGEYGTIILKGYKSYPENLTIKGGNGSSVAGIQISSGLGQAHYFNKLDISESIMPKGLSLVGIYFTDSVILRNCGLEKFTIQGCYFGQGARIFIGPNDLEWGVSGQRYENALVRVKDLVIRGNTITNASGSQDNAILVLEAENAYICDNTIHKAAYAGIQVGGRGGVRTSIGQIGIGNNTIKSTGSRSIRIATLENARLVILANQMYDANKTITGTDCIRVTNCRSTTVLAKNNLYNDGYISQGNGYFFEAYAPIFSDHRHTADQVEGLTNFIVEQQMTGAVRYRKWDSGFAEIWFAKVPYELAGNAGLVTLNLPVSLFNDGNLTDSPQYQVTVLPSDCNEFAVLKRISSNTTANNMCSSVELTFAPTGEALPGMAEIYVYITGKWK